MTSQVIRQLHADLDSDLRRIAKRFKNPRITLIVRNPDVGDTGDVVLTDEDDYEQIIAAVRRAQDPNLSETIEPNRKRA